MRQESQGKVCCQSPMAVTGIQVEGEDFMSIETEHGVSFEARKLAYDEILERAVELMEKVAPAFAECGGEVDAFTAVKACAMEKAVCFVGEENGKLSALLIAEFIDFPLKRVCNVLAYAGRARDYRWFNEWLENWAIEQGAVEMRGYGQAGPAKLAERYGYKEIYRVYAKPLKGPTSETSTTEM